MFMNGTVVVHGIEFWVILLHARQDVSYFTVIDPKESFFQAPGHVNVRLKPWYAC